MKKISIVLIIAAFAVLMACSSPGPDMSKNQKNIDWSFVKSPQTGTCYEMMTLSIAAAYSPATYSGMSPVDDKYCIGK